MSDKPRLILVGEDGNAFSILARATKAAKKAGWTEDRIKEMRKKAMSAGYEGLLDVMMDYFEVE